MFANMLYLLHPRNGEQLASAPHSQLMYAFYFEDCSSKPGQRALIVGQIRRWRGKDAQSGGKLRQNRNPVPRILAATYLSSLGPVNHKPTHEEVLVMGVSLR